MSNQGDARSRTLLETLDEEAADNDKAARTLAALGMTKNAERRKQRAARLRAHRERLAREVEAKQEAAYQDLRAVWAGEAKLSDAGAIRALIAVAEEIAASHPGEGGIGEVVEQARAELNLLLGGGPLNPKGDTNG